MKFWRFWIVWAAILLAIGAAGDNFFQIPGFVHGLHTLFSDGEGMPNQIVTIVAEKKLQFFATCDHYKQIDQKFSLLKLQPKPYGFENYAESFQNNQVTIIYGTELETSWGDGKKSHMIYLSPTPLVYDPEIIRLENQPNSQQELINYLHQKGGLVIAAHPFNPSYPFDREHAEGIDGIELWNDGKIENCRKTFLWCLELLSQGKNIFVTTGGDIHTLVQPDIVDRLSRITRVFARDNSREAIWEGFSRGRTYACRNGVRSTGLDYHPGFDYQKVARPQFEFDICFDEPITANKYVRIYRGEKIVREWALVKGEKRVGFFWEDEEVGIGRQNYLIEVENCLAMPIRLEVISSPQNEATITLFKKLGIEIYSEPDAKEQLGAVCGGSSKEGEDPVPYYQNHFKAPVYLRFYVIFENKDRPGESIWTTQDLKWWLLIYGPDGRLKDELGAGMRSGPGGPPTDEHWKTCWTTRTAYFDKPGRYRLVLQNRARRVIREYTIEIE